MYDLILRSGFLYDPENGLQGEISDIAVRDGRVEKISADIRESGTHEIDLSGLAVTPGLVDFHAHFFSGGAGTALSYSSYLPTGVTNAVDAGSAGFNNLETFLSGQSELERRNTKVYMNLAAEGQSSLPTHNENIDPAYFDARRIRVMCERYPDRVIGLKLRISAPIAQQSGVTSFDSLRRAVEIAEECHLPLSVHMPDFEGELSELVDILRPGDIFCHAYTPKKGIMDGNSVSDEAVRCMKKGVLLETACGKGQVGHEVALAAFRKSLYPAIISGDFTRATYTFPPAGTLPYQMSRFMALGMNFEDVLVGCTATPAAKMDMKNTLGCIKEGCIANLAVFERKQGTFIFDDILHKQIRGKEMLIPKLTILEGNIVYNMLTYENVCK